MSRKCILEYRKVFKYVYPYLCIDVKKYGCIYGKNQGNDSRGDRCLEGVQETRNRKRYEDITASRGSGLGLHEEIGITNQIGREA